MKRNINILLSCIFLIAICSTACWCRNPRNSVDSFRHAPQATEGLLSFYQKSGSSDLDSYLSLARKADPYALVTGWFWDWRTISIYRSNPGFHYGYDIAMPAGTAVPSGWAGTVTAVAIWADGEWGVTVLTSDNYSITYGHISPRVSPGMTLNVGDVVGIVVHDHVDIKVKNGDGCFVDFGKTYGLIPVDGTAIINGINSYIYPFADTKVIIKARVEEISRLTRTISALEDYLQLELDNYRESKNRVDDMKKMLQEELICQKTLDDEKQQLTAAKQRAELLEKRLQAQKNRVTAIKKEISLYGWKGELPAKREKSGEKEKTESVSARKDVEQMRQKLILYKKLFEEGAVSRKELEEMEKNYKKAQLEAIFSEDTGRGLKSGGSRPGENAYP